MSSNLASVSSADTVIAALKVLAQEGTEGLTAARQKNPDFIELALTILGVQAARSRDLAKTEVPENSAIAPLSINSLSNAPNAPRSNTTPKHDSERLPGAGMKRRSATRDIIDGFGSRPATYMTRFVIMQHLANHTRDTSVKTILDELVHAGLMDIEQRPSLVTSLNRLKNNNKLITWPDTARGEQIALTPQGNAYLSELISKRLQANEIAYLKQHASASISAHLPQ
jgi:hypothetical protein